ncbi:MAG: YtxH domain-containing protein [Patescibacteria group bacterium]
MKGTLKGAALGALVASAAALLLAPKSGKQTRANLKKLLDTTSSDLQKKAKKLQTMTKQQYEELFLHSLAQATKKKEEVADLLEDVSGVLERGWADVKKEMKKTPTRTPQSPKRSKRS